MGANYSSSMDMTVDWGELQSIIRSMEAIERKFGPRKVKQIAANAAKSLRTEMRNLAPVYQKHQNTKKYMGKTVKYKKGTVKRSVAIKRTRKGILVAPRMGKRTKNVLGKPHLDAYWSHIVVETSVQNKDFVEKARLAKKNQVLRDMENEAKRLLKW